MKATSNQTPVKFTSNCWNFELTAPDLYVILTASNRGRPLILQTVGGDGGECRRSGGARSSRSGGARSRSRGMRRPRRARSNSGGASRRSFALSINYPRIQTDHIQQQKQHG